MSKVLVLTLLCMIAQLFSVTVEGYAFLEGETDHRGIEVFFQRVVPDTLYSYTLFTDSAGYYSSYIEEGWYDISYSKSEYLSSDTTEVILYSDQTLSSHTLLKLGLSGSISGILAPGEYTVSGSITVEEGDSLVIEPGVVLQFAPDTYFQINGFIHAVGDSENTILLTGVSDEKWEGLSLVNSAPDCILEYCVIEKSKTGVIVNHNDIKFDHLRIENNYTGITLEHNYSKENIYTSNTLEITNSKLNNNETGIRIGVTIADREMNILLKNNEICYNQRGISHEVTFDSTLVTPSLNIYIVNSNISYNDLNAMVFTGLCFRGTHRVVIANSILKNNESQGSMGVIWDDTVGQRSIEIQNSNFHNNTPSILSEFYGDNTYIGVNVTTNANGDPCDAYSNISMDPLFIDGWNGDFMLTENSPCIDAGTNTITDYTFPIADLFGNYRIWDGDGNGSEIVDMGAYEYGAPAGIEDQVVEVQNYTLHQNYPNPFNPVTTISYALPKSGLVELNVYNLNGQLVRSLVNGKMGKGVHKAEFNGTELTTGMFIYNLKVDGKIVQSKKMMMLK